MADIIADALTSFPLERAALCIDCDQVFCLRDKDEDLPAWARIKACPHCAGTTWIPLERFFADTGERKIIRFADVLHEVGNGLTPARAYAERLATGLQAYVDTGIARHSPFHHLFIAHARRVITAIDETMRRLHALGGSVDAPKEGAPRS